MVVGQRNDYLNVGEGKERSKYLHCQSKLWPDGALFSALGGYL